MSLSLADELLLAAQHGDIQSVQACLAMGVDIETRGQLNETPLMRAAEAGRVVVVKFLLDQGADPSLVDEDGHEALVHALALSWEFQGVPLNKAFEMACVILPKMPCSQGVYNIMPVAYYLPKEWSAQQILSLCDLGLPLEIPTIFNPQGENFLHALADMRQAPIDTLDALIYRALAQGSNFTGLYQGKELYTPIAWARTKGNDLVEEALLRAMGRALEQTTGPASGSHKGVRF